MHDEVDQLTTTSITIPSTRSINPERLSVLDNHALSTPKKVERDIQSLADYLMKAAQNDAEKVRLIFTWIAFHIDYDAKAINTGKDGEVSAEGVLKSGKSVCEGFANLFCKLGSAAGVDVVKISGYAKGYGYRPGQKFYKTDHAWNAVKIEGEWHLMDVTWGEGYGESKRGKLISRKRFNDYWFDVDPKKFIFTHLPEDNQWQQLLSPITKDQYEKLPYINPLLFYYGFPTDDIYNLVMKNKNTKFVTLYNVDIFVEVVDAPVCRDVKMRQPFLCIIRAENAYEIAATINNKWTRFEKEGNQFVLNFNPEPGELHIMVKGSKKEKRYQTLLSYRVVRSK